MQNSCLWITRWSVSSAVLTKFPIFTENYAVRKSCALPLPHHTASGRGRENSPVEKRPGYKKIIIIISPPVKQIPKESTPQPHKTKGYLTPRQRLTGAAVTSRRANETETGALKNPPASHPQPRRAGGGGGCLSPATSPEAGAGGPSRLHSGRLRHRELESASGRAVVKPKPSRQRPVPPYLPLPHRRSTGRATSSRLTLRGKPLPRTAGGRTTRTANASSFRARRVGWSAEPAQPASLPGSNPAPFTEQSPVHPAPAQSRGDSA